MRGSWRGRWDRSTRSVEQRRLKNDEHKSERGKSKRVLTGLVGWCKHRPATVLELGEPRLAALGLIRLLDGTRQGGVAGAVKECEVVRKLE